MASEKRARITGRSFFKRLFWFFLGGPAAIGAVARFDESFGFGSFLKKVILHYREVTRAFWDFVLGWVPFPVPVDRDLITLVLLFSIPVGIRKYVLRQRTTAGEYASAQTFRTIQYLSMGCFLVIVFSLLFIGNDFQVMNDLMENSIYRWLVLATVFLWIGLSAWYYPNTVNMPLYLVLSGAMFLLLYPLLVSSSFVASYGYFWMFANGVLFFAIMVGFASVNIRAYPEQPVYIVVFALGIFGVDWFARDVAPGLNAWLCEHVAELCDGV